MVHATGSTLTISAPLAPEGSVIGWEADAVIAAAGLLHCREGPCACGSRDHGVASQATARKQQLAA